MFCGTKKLREMNGKQWLTRAVVQKNKVLGGEDDNMAFSTPNTKEHDVKDILGAERG